MGPGSGRSDGTPWCERSPAIRQPDGILAERPLETSPVDNPRRYRIGNASETLGDRRAGADAIRELNLWHPRGWGQLTTEVAPRIAPILLLVRTAASADPDMAGLQSELSNQRLERMTHNAGSLARLGCLRDEVTVELAGEILWSYSSPELYELLVLIRGWPLERYGTFIADAMIAALLWPGRATRGRR